MKTIGIGGVFLRTKDSQKTRKWYENVLGIVLEDWNGTVFIGSERNHTIFSLFSEDDNYFPTEQKVMLNFQIDNMNEFLEHIKKLEITALRDLEVSEYGKFIWIQDPDGNMIEVWEK